MQFIIIQPTMLSTFNTLSPKEQTYKVADILMNATKEYHHLIFVVPIHVHCKEKKRLQFMAENIDEGVYVSKKSRDSFKRNWVGEREWALKSVAMISDYVPDANEMPTVKFYKAYATMYTYLHNGDMEKFEKYAQRVLVQLNDILTDSMEEYFVLLGLVLDAQNNNNNRYEVNTDRCTMALADMMQVVQLTQKVWTKLRHSKLTRGQAVCEIAVLEFECGIY